MNLSRILDPHPGDSPAIITAGEVVSYGALRQQVSAVAGGLASLGVGPGDRVATALSSNWYAVVSYLAAMHAGAVAVPLNPQSPTPELQRELAAVGAKVVVIGPTSAEAYAGVDRAAAGIDHTLTPEGVDLAGARPFEDLLVSAAMAALDRAPDDLAALLFTSGTAGPPRAAMLTHANLVANLGQMQGVPGRSVGPADVTLCVLPLFHIFGLNAVLGLALYGGASVVLVQRFDPASALASIVDRGVTIVPGVPPMFDAWMSMTEVDAPAHSFAGVRLLVSGASRLDPDLAARFERRFAKTIGEGYGLTEAAPVVTAAGDPPRAGTIGLPVPGQEIRLVDANGEDALEGDPGEIWVKGPNVFAGYWNDPDATRRVLVDGWLHTGDIAVADADGYLTLVDRAKNLIIVSGFNVFPAEVEDVLLEHPGVADAVVVGLPHPHTGETVKAFVVARSDRQLDEDELIAFCGRSLARYKCPTKVQFVPDLPRGLGGKVVRRHLPM